MEIVDYLHLDRKYLWHPFTQMQKGAAIFITKGKGAYLYDENGKSYLDVISSWWVNLHGHAHPYIVEKIRAQAEILEHVLFAGFTHAPAVNLAVRLLSLLPKEMSKVFYSDNGSTAVEVAIKMALQFWTNENSETKRKKVVCFKNSYHGDTFGSMSVAGKNEWNRPFWNYLFPVETIEAPLPNSEEIAISQLKSLLERGDIACFIFEPLILGSGGMIPYSAEGLDALIDLCQKNEVLSIADEVMTGFGRTEKLFACDYLKGKPDLICLSKGLTGGFLPLGATVCTEKIYQAFLGKDLKAAFLHGHSYTANPLSCTSALASLDLLLEKSCFNQREIIALSHQGFCRNWKGHPKLTRCESLGTILALEYKTEAASYFHPLKELLENYFLSKGILIRPLGNVLYLMPPYCIQETELTYVYECVAQTLEGGS